VDGDTEPEACRNRAHEEKKAYEFGLHATIRESKHRILSAVVARLDHYGVTSGGSCSGTGWMLGIANGCRA